MISFLKFFSKKASSEIPSVLADMHSHLLPGLDDGVDNFEESIELIREFASLGYKKLITTPHVMGDFFRNTPESIHAKLEELKGLVAEANIDISLEAAAEYYLDESFMEKLRNGKKLLTFGNKYLLFETSYINESSFLKEAVFLIRSLGYKPVLAHPERYIYLYSDFEKFLEISEMGVLFQLNINSLSGYYSPIAKRFAEKLIDAGMVSFIGSDCHGTRHLEALRKSREKKYYRKLGSLPLLNNSLL